MINPVEAAALRPSYLFGDLPEDELDQLAGLMRRRAFRRGEVVFHQGDLGESLHVVLEGRLKVVLAADSGEEIILAILTPGDLFGEVALLDGGPRSATVIAMEPVATATLHRADFLGLLRRSPLAVEAVLATMARTIRRDTEELADLAGLDVHARLLKKLLELADAHGRSVDGVIEIQLSLTQGDLAAMIGATRASVNKLLGFYDQRGAIARRGRRIAILKPEMLSARASY